MRTVVWLVSLLVATEEEPVQFSSLMENLEASIPRGHIPGWEKSHAL